jgi:hypothetical protein
MNDFTGTGTPLSANGFATALNQLGCKAEALWSVLATETSGCGYMDDRRPKILFERHIFHRLTSGQFDAQDPDISAPTPGGYGPAGAHQYDRLQAAILLNETAALQSASWGLGQILGTNFAAAGYANVQDMVDAFVGAEDAQLAGMASFIAGSAMKAAITAQNWASFARLYNGPDYAANNYDGHLASYYAGYVAHGCPDIGIREVQILLNYQGYAVTIDGQFGPETGSALAQFRAKMGLAGGDGPPDPPTLDKLGG